MIPTIQCSLEASLLENTSGAMKWPEQLFRTLSIHTNTSDDKLDEIAANIEDLPVLNLMFIRPTTAGHSSLILKSQNLNASWLDFTSSDCSASLGFIALLAVGAVHMLGYWVYLDAWVWIYLGSCFLSGKTIDSAEVVLDIYLPVSTIPVDYFGSSAVLSGCASSSRILR